MSECDDCRWQVDGCEGRCCMYDCPAFDYGGEDCPMFEQEDWDE